ncbi:ABC transporter ATP-binding protein [Methanobacterium sp.]|uniref:ABC transporter ATP-binding protein n=1 Tax=Methanobacterium sp. TaxID=2164 RepID=UPI002AB8EDB9|nr:ABC transporter ATP-binding protein [Methanobacterium sp.]MDY9924092.1 ABC transporter ATP-binding protein [Methanobacterium sp.]
MVNNVIEAKSLVKNYGDFTAVNNISFNVKKGEVFAFLGPNGAGKTTTVEMMECLKSLTAGSIKILGNDIKNDEIEIKRRIGVLPQDFGAFQLLTVYQNIDYFAQMYPKHVEVDDLIKMLGLKDKRDILFGYLSGGLKQRVGIAISLVNDPEIVFLDEPTTGLDPKARRDVWAAIKDLKARGKTIILTTHYMEEAQNLADRVCILHNGRIIAEGTPEDLIGRYGGDKMLIIRKCSETAKNELINTIQEYTIDGDNVLVKLSGENDMKIISKAASIIDTGKSTCEELYVKKATLEDVFLNLTGDKLIEGGK